MTTENPKEMDGNSSKDKFLLLAAIKNGRSLLEEVSGVTGSELVTILLHPFWLWLISMNEANWVGRLGGITFGVGLELKEEAWRLELGLEGLYLGDRTFP